MGGPPIVSKSRGPRCIDPFTTPIYPALHTVPIYFVDGERIVINISSAYSKNLMTQLLTLYPPKMEN